MLTDLQTRAVGLLFEFADREVARKLRVRRETIEAWKRDPEFAQALCDHLRENRRIAARILSRLYIEACRELDLLIKSDDDKNKPKIIVEVLKASGLFKELGVEEGDYVGNLLDRLADEPEDTEPGEAD